MVVGIGDAGPLLDRPEHWSLYANLHRGVERCAFSTLQQLAAAFSREPAAVAAALAALDELLLLTETFVALECEVVHPQLPAGLDLADDTARRLREVDRLRNLRRVLAPENRVDLRRIGLLYRAAMGFVTTWCEGMLAIEQQRDALLSERHETAALQQLQRHLVGQAPVRAQESLLRWMLPGMVAQEKMALMAFLYRILPKKRALALFSALDIRLVRRAGSAPHPHIELPGQQAQAADEQAARPQREIVRHVVLAHQQE